MTTGILGIIAGLALGAAGLHAQIGAGTGVGVGGGRGVGVGAPVEFQQFQQAGTIGAIAGGRGDITMVKANPGNTTVAGRPVSAMEERKSVQTLGDGTEISTSDTDLFFRDSQGRTRVEQTSQGRTTIQIMDPVARVNITLIPATKTARRTSFPENMALVWDGPVTASGMATATVTMSTGPTSVATARAVTGGRRGGGPAENILHEELGVQSQNGVLATGTRNTLTIPQGQIGNNRDIHVVNERWYSDDLQMLVKTVNSDPRFGENTYELTNVSRVEPDPALFQIPADYRVVEPAAGRAGRGVLTAPAPAINK